MLLSWNTGARILEDHWVYTLVRSTGDKLFQQVISKVQLMVQVTL